MTALIIQTEQKTAQYFRERLNTSIELDMILVQGGEFNMGSPDTEEERNESESPQHLVTVKTFFLGRYPVTQEQWQIVAQEFPQVKIKLNPKPSHFEGDRRPVEQVSWYEAVEYCDRLAKYTKRPYRLPTEAEWEYACRAGTTTPFYFGNTLSTDLANYDGNFTYGNGVKGEYREETTPVDHFKIANAWGLCDMHGNVDEWCQDYWHDDYSAKPDRLKQNGNEAWIEQGIGENDNHYHIIRGGSWYHIAWVCRSAYRLYLNPAVRNSYLGFRVVCGAPGLL